nr:MAG TPA: hypothetical protein [Caudoviricetes sp.]
MHPTITLPPHHHSLHCFYYPYNNTNNFQRSYKGYYI